MRGKSKFFSGLILAGAVCIAGAQTTATVDMTGIVNDVSNGAPIVGATVTLANNSTLTTTTGADGSFHLTGTATGIHAKGANAKQGMSLVGTTLSILVQANNTPVAIDVFNIKSEHVKTLLSENASSGRYNVNVASELPGGMYIVRAHVGSKSASFKVTTLGTQGAAGNIFRSAAYTRTVLAKTAVVAIDDTIKITKAGFRAKNLAITTYNTFYPIDMIPALKAGDLSLIAQTKSSNQVDWGRNVDVQVWDGGTQLEGGYKVSPFEGPDSWKVTFTAGQLYSAWGFVTKTAPEDMSQWKGGIMHIAVKGTAPTIGVTMASADQGSGTSIKLDLTKYGYSPIAAGNLGWHDCAVPMDDFVGTDMSQITTYLGLVYPVEPDTAFSSSFFYQVDGVYWSQKK